MKKLLLVLVLLSGTSSFINATNERNQVKLIIKHNNGGIGEVEHPRTPILIPTIILDNHTLYLYSGCDNTTIEILDEDEMVVYSASITEGTETIELPSALIGTYEIHISRGMFVFTGEIEL